MSDAPLNKQRDISIESDEKEKQKHRGMDHTVEKYGIFGFLESSLMRIIY